MFGFVLCKNKFKILLFLFQGIGYIHFLLKNVFIVLKEIQKAKKKIFIKHKDFLLIVFL